MTEAARDLVVTILPITPQHIYRIFSLPLHYRDPFDRIIIATALTEQLPLISGDRDQEIRRFTADLEIKFPLEPLKYSDQAVLIEFDRILLALCGWQEELLPRIATPERQAAAEQRAGALSFKVSEKTLPSRWRGIWLKRVGG